MGHNVIFSWKSKKGHCFASGQFIYFPDQKDRMPVLIQKLKKRNGLLAAFSVLSGVLLLTGQIFNCCLINGSFARDAKQFFHGLGVTHSDKHGVAEDADSDPHAHCHGKEIRTDADGNYDPIGNQAGYAQNCRCLSELAIPKQAMVGNQSLFLEPASAPSIAFLEPLLAKSLSIDRPLPQNKSSPPVYLLTLRILI